MSDHGEIKLTSGGPELVYRGERHDHVFRGASLEPMRLGVYCQTAVPRRCNRICIYSHPDHCLYDKDSRSIEDLRPTFNSWFRIKSNFRTKFFIPVRKSDLVHEILRRRIGLARLGHTGKCLSCQLHLLDLESAV